MSERLVPEGLSLMELAAVNWVLSAVKTKVLTGVPSGQVIDQALEECLRGAGANGGNTHASNQHIGC